MPTYEYICKKNQHPFEVVKSFKEYDSTKEQHCPICDSDSKRVYSAPQISIEYIERTDYRSSLGTTVSNKRELKETLKRKGLMEMPPENVRAAKERNESLKQKKQDTGLTTY